MSRARITSKFSYKEDRKILRYIIKHEAYHQIKGNKLWIKLEKEEFFKRSWVSAKRHFLKTIYKNLKRKEYKLLPNQITMFHMGFRKSSFPGQTRIKGSNFILSEYLHSYFSPANQIMKKMRFSEMSTSGSELN